MSQEAISDENVSLQLVHDFRSSCFVFICICTMLDFVGQACIQEFKDKKSPANTVKDRWLE
jgi:hypothetical protein